MAYVAINLFLLRAPLLPWTADGDPARRLLDVPAARAQARLRHAPSLLGGNGRVRWLAFGDGAAEQREADLDERLVRVLAVSGEWTDWTSVRRFAGAETEAYDDGDAPA